MSAPHLIDPDRLDEVRRKRTATARLFGAMAALLLGIGLGAARTGNTAGALFGLIGGGLPALLAAYHAGHARGVGRAASKGRP